MHLADHRRHHPHPDLGPRASAVTQAPGGHFCALLGSRSVRCWGDGLWGQLGRQSDERIGDDETVGSQGDIPLGLDVVQVAAGGTSTCVLQRSGAVRCWGYNNYGQLGQGDTTSIGKAGGAAPANAADIDLGGPALQVAVGGWHACARMAAGGVRCWGRGLEGQLGYGDTNNVADGSTQISTPALAGDVPLGVAQPISYVATGAYHSCVVVDGGAVKCWGSNAGGELGYPFSGQVGDGNAQRPLPSDVSALPLGPVAAAELSLGNQVSCARFVDGTVKCWGSNIKGQLGTGDFVGVGGSDGRPLSMREAIVLPDVAATIRTGSDHVCALVSGQAYCWGAGEFGKLGNESPADVSTPRGPIELGAGRTVLAIGLVGRTSCALQQVDATSQLEARCWGWGGNGALGAGSTADVGASMGSMPPAVTPLF